MNLFEIKREILACTTVDPETGIESIDTVKLAALQADSEEIIENLACWIRNLESDASALKEQKMMFQKRQQSAEKKAESLKAYLSDFLNGSKFTSPKVKVSPSTSITVEIGDLSEIPDKYCEFKKMPKLTEIRNEIKLGNYVPGAYLMQHSSVRIA